MLTTRLLRSEYKAIEHKPQTSRRYGRKQKRRVETGLRAGNFVCFIPRESRGLDKCGVNNNKEWLNKFVATLMLLAFGISITVKHQFGVKQVSVVEQLIQFMKQNSAVVILALQREYSSSHSNFSSEVASYKQSEWLLRNWQRIFRNSELSLEKSLCIFGKSELSLANSQWIFGKSELSFEKSRRLKQ